MCIGDFEGQSEEEGYCYLLLKMAKLAIPAIISCWVILLQETTNMIFVARLGDPKNSAAIGIGNAIINMFALSLIVGMNSVLNS